MDSRWLRLLTPLRIGRPRGQLRHGFFGTDELCFAVTRADIAAIRLPDSG